MISRATDKFGLGKVLTTGAVFQMVGYCVFIAPPPFPVLPVTYAFVGFGVAYQDAGANAFVGFKTFL